MEDRIVCTLDRNEVYADKSYRLQLTMENRMQDTWKVSKENDIILSIPIGTEEADLAKSSQGIEIVCHGLTVEPTGDGTWRLYADQEALLVELGQKITIQISGPEPYLGKIGTNYMSGILVSYSSGDSNDFTECLPVYKVEDKLAILYFSVAGKAIDRAGCCEVEFGEEITLEWEFTGAERYQLAPFGFCEPEQRKRKVTVWQDTIYSLIIYDKETFCKEDICIRIKKAGTGRIKDIHTDVSEAGARIHLTYEAASFAFIDRGVGRVKNGITLSDYVTGENYFLHFPGKEATAGHFMLEGEDALRLECFRYFMRSESGEKSYSFRWKVAGCSGKILIEKEGVKVRADARGEMNFTSSCDETVMLNLEASDAAGRKVVIHDICPYEIKDS